MSVLLPAIEPHVRWMLRRDIGEVLAIERRGAFAGPWGETDLFEAIRGRDQVAMVAERGEELLGWMVLRLEKEAIELVRLTVRPEVRRRGVGGAMVRKVEGRVLASEGRRVRAWAEVDEYDDDTIRFLRGCGWKAVEVVREGGWWADSYVFEYQARECGGR